MQLLIGFLLAALIAFIAYRARSLSRSGALGTTLVGAVVFGIGGWPWAVLLLTFFLTSTGLTRAFKKRKTGLSEKFSKGGQRDIGQVFGNGGLAALFAGLWHFFPGQVWVWAAFAASLAAVNADTWATELGVLNPHSTRLITNLGKVVEKGASGGISWVGTLASLAGSGVLGFLAVAVAPLPVSPYLGILVTLAGLGGSLFDSLLGASVQAIYHCPTCDKETERHPLHTCGAQTKLARGWPWLSNDWVNFACGAFGALTTLLFLLKI